MVGIPNAFPIVESHRTLPRARVATHDEAADLVLRAQDLRPLPLDSREAELLRRIATGTISQLAGPACLRIQEVADVAPGTELALHDAVGIVGTLVVDTISSGFVSGVITVAALPRFSSPSLSRS